MIVSLDLEATGLSSAIDHVIEIGAVKFRGAEVLDRYHTLVNPGLRLPGMIKRLTGIDDAELATAPRLVEVIPGLREFIGEADLLAHGAGYDISFLHDALGEDPGRRSVFDTIDLARVVLPSAPAYSLGGLCDHVALSHPRPHHALEDAEATFRLFLDLVGRLATMPDRLLVELRDLSRGSGHSIEVLLHRVLGAAIGSIPVAGVLTPPAPSSTTPVALAPEQVAALLGPSGPLASEPGWELRESQQQMCLAVAQAFARERNLVVEAGTGVGKSLAYLLPALAWATANGERVAVSTYTINLQEQLLHKDLPLAARILGIPLRAVLLKGRGHYLSRLRWEQLVVGTGGGPGGVSELEGIDPAELLIFKLKLATWLQTTRTGDRDELRLFGQEERIWRSVASEWSDCRTADCVLGPRPCFYHRSRQRASEADVVVVNHALLLADAFNEGASGLPVARHLVIDEAHHLEEAGTKGLTEEYREEDLLGLVALSAVGVGSGRSATVARLEVATRALLDQLRLAAQDIFGNESGRELILDSRWAGSAAADQVRSRVREVEATLADLSEVEAAVVRGRLAAALRVLGEARDGRVNWISFNRDSRVQLRTAPVEVSEQLREALFSERGTVVLTSATLALNGSFEYLRRRTGLPSSRLEELVLESPFDFLAQALLCIPDDVPAPGEPGFLEALVEMVDGIARRLHGRTMVLFTSNDQLAQAAAQLRLKLEPDGIEVLAQLRGTSRRQLTDRFVSRPDSVLLGTASFWEGVDMPGSALSCVVIVRLPFRPPSDPVMRARGERLKDPFLELALPEAVLRLKQGFGRLIRRATDRGAVVILDSRVSTRAYGRHFLESLPECGSWAGSGADLPGAVGEWVEGRGTILLE
ncbi:MAG: helicase C-terminal domain-containing protein [Candidatus Dormibacteria bacterium]